MLYRHLRKDHCIHDNALQKSDQNKHKHRRNIKNSDPRNNAFDRDHYRIGNTADETEKCIRRKNEPARQKTYKNKEYQNAQKAIKNVTDENFRAAGKDAEREPVNDKTNIPYNIDRKICDDERDQDRDKRREPCVDAVKREKPGRRIDEFFREFAYAKTETADLSERIRVGVIEYHSKQHQQKKEQKAAP
jgi:hypothetical protein